VNSGFGDDEREPRRVTLTAAIAAVVAAVVLTAGIATWIANRGPSPNATDVGFYDDMSTHHQQAITMAQIYYRYGTDPLLREIAEKITLAQAGEVRLMQQALVDWHKSGSPDVAMEWMGMHVPQDAQPGMATPAEVNQLSAARGSALDDLFTRLMIDHHQGGIDMAAAAEKTASIGSVKRLAENMVNAQRGEIAEMNHRRELLGLPRHQPTT
jgi:uncharacterized protein (DUF305 family)